MSMYNLKLSMYRKCKVGFKDWRLGVQRFPALPFRLRRQAGFRVQRLGALGSKVGKFRFQRFRAGIKSDPIRTRESDLYQGLGTRTTTKKKTIMTHVLPNAIAYLCLALTLDLRYSVYEQVVLSQGSKLLRLAI